jgi:hypothetical protein
MAKVKLVHWNFVEAQELAERFLSSDFKIDAKLPDQHFLKELRANRPDVILISLDRLPAQGRDLAVSVRSQKSVCSIPIVFGGGKSDKVEKIRQLLPDAVYAEWDRASQAVSEAIQNPPEHPITFESGFSAYADTPLPKKLGIKANSMVALIDAPDGFEEVLGPLPTGASLSRELEDQHGLTIWFVRTLEVLQKEIGRAVELSRRGSVWIAWPKRGSRLESDLTQQKVREIGLGAGLVDYKICSIDEAWSGLLFSFKSKR